MEAGGEIRGGRQERPRGLADEVGPWEERACGPVEALDGKDRHGSMLDLFSQADLAITRILNT